MMYSVMLSLRINNLAQNNQLDYLIFKLLYASIKPSITQANDCPPKALEAA